MDAQAADAAYGCEKKGGIAVFTAKATVTRQPRVTADILRARWREGLTPLAAQALNDCNAYVRDDTGALMRSSAAASDLPNGILRWTTPYARRVYYSGVPSRAHNPNASLRWCEKAKAARLAAWLMLARKMLGGKTL